MITYWSKSDITDEQAQSWLSEMAPNLRRSDFYEIAAHNGRHPDHVLKISYFMSDLAWIGTVNGKPVITFGLDGDCCWMLGTSDIERGAPARQIARDTRSYLDVMLAESPSITNWVDLRNDRSLRWLLWSGFKIQQIDMEHGIERRPFVKVIRSL
jgi:hypothetical protein